MMCAPGAARSRRGFTLLEVIVGVLLLTLLSVSLYRFLYANLEAIRVGTEMHSEKEAIGKVIDLVQTYLVDMPPKGQGMIAGRPVRLREIDYDELQWMCKPGAGIMTSAGSGDYKVTFQLRPRDERGSVYDLGLRRQTFDGPDTEWNWLPLIEDVASLRIRYFDQRLNAPVERWSDPNARPSLISVTIWKRLDEAPYEAVLTVPSAMLQQ
jgi:prepilin-type N-terminal cleavage/methylation domain-containing protein